MRVKKPGPPKGKKHSDIRRSAFGERLFRTRRARGMSQTELGKRVGISRRMVSHYEGNVPEGPSLTNVTKIAEALNVTVGSLLGENTQQVINDDVRPRLRKNFQKILNLPLSDQRKVIEYVDLLSKKHGDEKNR